MPLGAVLFVMNITEGVLREQTVRDRPDRGRLLVFELGWVVDGLSIMMFFLVDVVGLLVFIYAVGYMQGDVRVDCSSGGVLPLRRVDAASWSAPPTSSS